MASLPTPGSQWTRRPSNLAKGEQRRPEILRLNPNGKVPVLVDGETSLWESNAIAAFIAGRADSDLWPKGEQRYDIMRWCYWEANRWNPPIGKIIGQRIFKRSNPDQRIIDEGISQFRAMAAILNGHLEASKYVSGEALTVADFVVGVWLGYAQSCDLPMVEFGHIQRWYQRLGRLPAWDKVVPPTIP